MCVSTSGKTAIQIQGILETEKMKAWESYVSWRNFKMFNVAEELEAMLEKGNIYVILSQEELL